MIEPAKAKNISSQKLSNNMRKTTAKSRRFYGKLLHPLNGPRKIKVSRGQSKKIKNIWNLKIEEKNSDKKCESNNIRKWSIFTAISELIRINLG